MTAPTATQGYTSISSLLKRLSTLESARKVTADEIAAAVGLIFTNSVSPIQFALLLWALHTTGQDHLPGVLAACAGSMREAAAQVDEKALQDVVRQTSKAEGAYGGGLVWYAPSIDTQVVATKVLILYVTVRHSRHRWRRAQHL